MSLVHHVRVTDRRRAGNTDADGDRNTDADPNSDADPHTNGDANTDPVAHARYRHTGSEYADADPRATKLGPNW